MDQEDDLLNLWRHQPNLVLPQILPKYLFTADILSCRLVSNRWKQAIDMILQLHPDRLPYKSARLEMLTEYQFNCHSFPKLSTRFAQVVKSGYQGPENPFLGRYVEIIVGDGENQIKDLEECIPLLEQVGNEIWYVRFYLKSCGDQQVQTLFQCLAYLRNLKSFRVEVKLPSYRKQVDGPRTQNLVNFPGSLETLDLSQLEKVDPDVYTLLLSTLTNHQNIKKLGVNLVYWEQNYGTRFPNLTELYITCNVFWFTGGLQQILQIMQELQSPNLQKLRIMNFRMNVFGLLKYVAEHYKRIESLELVGYKLWEKAEKGDQFIIPSIIDLKILVTPQLQFRFLDCLPSLQYLNLHWDWASWPCTQDRVVSSSYFATCLRRFYYEDRLDPENFAGIWIEMPELKMLTIFWKDSISRQYIREDQSKVYTPFVRRPRHDFDY